jgi:hypothetical protein
MKKLFLSLLFVAVAPFTHTQGIVINAGTLIGNSPYHGRPETNLR